MTTKHSADMLHGVPKLKKAVIYVPCGKKYLC